MFSFLLHFQSCALNLKLLAEDIVDTYTLSFPASLKQGTLPEDWKTAKIIPLFKKGNKFMPENYRPVSLTSISCKLLEHIIYSNVMDHLEKHCILTNIQHGFRQKRSCETQLLTTVSEFTECLNNRSQIDSILLDFSKAFDKVDHKGLILKLEAYGIRQKPLNWIRSFLLNRTQKVIIDGTESDTSNVLSGVPQGTVLGPILFLIYINDICSNLNPGTKLRLFADDSFLYREIKSNQDNKLLQEDLNTLQRWEMKWKMEFHPDKCQVLRITNKRKPIPASYTIHNKTLNETNQAKYLGVIIDSKLQWNYQNKYICKKTNNVLGFLRRNTSSLPKTVKENCYKTLVKPVIEYGCSVWDPHTKDQISNLDKIQKSAARYVLNDYTFEKGATNTNMNKLGWISLQEQRAKIKVTNFLQRTK